MADYISLKFAQANTLLDREKISGSFHRNGKNSEEKLEKACNDFEGIMIQQILKTMRKTVPEGGIFEKSHGIDIWESAYDEKLSFSVSGRKKGMGLARFLYEELSSNEKLKTKP
ncbi:MAG: hypothetical protein CSB21_02365 [Deltaproteobacteria bacterium]|nr:MAG: hypothetical protein CSB21_02365 [Deltaproteobacteria bacterium]